MMKHGVALVLAAVLIAAIAPSANAQQFYGDVRILSSVSFCGVFRLLLARLTATGSRSMAKCTRRSHLTACV